VQLASIKVDIFPSKRQHLTSTQTQRQRNTIERFQRIAAHRFKQCLGLLWREWCDDRLFRARYLN
jgi:hypothetical protein